MGAGGGFRREAWWIAVASLVAAALLWHPAFRQLDATGLWDWHYFHHMWEAGVVALSRFGEWPLWDPFHCGGVTIFGNPQNQLFAPLYFFSFLIGPTAATKLWVLLHAAAGFSGMILFARREGALGWPGALLAAVAWGASGFFAWHGARGHSALLPFYYAPWLLLAWRAAARDPRWTAGVAALLGLVLLEGGGYPFAFFLLLLGFDALVRLASRQGRGRILVAGLVAAPLTLLLGAVRLLPVLDQMLGRPRTRHFADALSASEVLGMLTVREHGLLHAGHRYLWTEYGSYVGWGVVALAVLGAGVAWRRGRIQWVLGLVVFLGFTVGHYGPWSPWELLQRLPLYESLRAPSRFAVFFSFYLALLAGLGLDALERALAALPSSGAWRWLRRLLPWLVFGLLAADVFAVALTITDQWRGRPIGEVRPAGRYHLDDRFEYLRWYASLPRMGIGTTRCYEPMRIAVADGLWTGSGPQARIAAGDGSVVEWGRTTSTAFARVELREPATVVFNQNHAPGWRSSVGRVRADHQGRLVVDLMPGEHRIELRYVPRSLVPGIAGSVLGLVLTVLAARWLSWPRLERALRVELR